MQVPEWAQPVNIKRKKVTAGTKAKALFMGSSTVAIKIREVLQKIEEMDLADNFCWYSEAVDISKLTEEETKEIEKFFKTANLPYVIIDGLIRVMI